MATVETRPKRVLITGATGRMGRVLTPLAKLAGWEVCTPSHAELDITNTVLCRMEMMNISPDMIIHLAALASTVECERDYRKATLVNETGTANLLGARSIVSKRTCKFIFLSTDYVFDGRQGNYKETDKALPVNFYGLSKLMAEQLVLAEHDTAVLRAPFRADPPWRYPSAFTDQWTSCDFASVVAPKIWAFAEWFCPAERSLLLPGKALLHIGGPRRSILELSQLAGGYGTEIGRTQEVEPLTRAEIPGVLLPRDTSLDSSLWQSLTEQFTQ